MRIEEKELRFAITNAKELAEYHSSNYIGSDDPVKSADQLADICGQYLQKNISFKEHPISSESSAVKGFFVAYDDRYEIVLLSGLNNCWSRLVKAKELFHVVMDKEEYRNPSISELITQVTVTFPEIDGEPDAYAATELLTEIAAMEYLFPYKIRQTILKAATDGHKEVEYQEIAVRHKIPRVLVEKYMSTDYMTVLGKYEAALAN